MNRFPDPAITFRCPKCGKQIKEALGRMERHKRVTCPTCGPIAVDTERLARARKEIQRAASKLRATIKIKL